MKYNSLQFLRGISAFLVLLLHVIQYSNFKPFDFNLPAQAAVDIFFLLSGFIILSSLSEFDTYITFIIKRFFRIFPAYWVVLLIFIFTNTFYFNITPNILNITKNIFLLPYSNQKYDCSIVGVAWSTMFEIYFYFLITILLAFNISKRYIPHYLIFSIILILIIFRFFNASIFSSSQLLNSMQMILESTHLLMFISGTLIFLFFYFIQKIINSFNNLWTLFIVSILFFTLFIQPYNTVVALFVVPLTFCFWINSETKKILNFENNIFLKLFIKIGDLSYSIFLIHMLFILIFLRLFNKNVLALFFFTVFFSTLSAFILFNYIEKPFIDYSKKLIYKYKFIKH